MGGALTTIGFDADDTLWHNKRYFALSHDRFAALLAEHSERDHLMTRLLEAERRNLPHYGYGIKGFTLSMIETAIEVTEGKVPAEVINDLLAAGREMLAHPIELLPHVEEVLQSLQGRYRLIVVTKGDLLDQERKLAQSGLRDLFDAVEIVSYKTEAAYRRIFKHHGEGAAQGLMVGNSLASDVRPMLDAGGWGVYVPHDLTWAMEHAEPPTNSPRFAEIEDLSGLSETLDRIRSG
ncbi:HAD family hydrolase [Sulfitobacter dubius]|uniref:HAD family hydrolase n=1 Tax=Sulfitobacter dubius TaxID=218673 RepID=UPI0008E21EA7|nr:HAD family hydrolase [Sulfitobacter dubius]SFG84811.1 putative hydrolase of the HAD superfamily [Sulfitobacter dubius]